jgi:hypothetical protein
MNPQKYTDTSAKIEYLFLGFPNLLSDEEKKDLIVRYGKARRKPVGKQEFKSGAVVGVIDYGEVWEDQLILRTAPSREKNSEEEIRTLEIQDPFSRV